MGQNATVLLSLLMNSFARRAADLVLPLTMNYKNQVIGLRPNSCCLFTNELESNMGLEGANFSD